MATPSMEVRDGVAWIKLDRPKVRNALDVDSVRAIKRHVAAMEDDPVVRACVLTGTGDVFCAGGDVGDMTVRRGRGAATFEQHMEGLAGLVAAVLQSRVPWVARVNGPAVGAGLGLVLMCDLAVAAGDAHFGAPFVNVGLVADTGVSALLTRCVGMHRAKRLLLTGHPIDAEEARSWGIVDQVVPRTDLDTAVDQLVTHLRSLPAQTLENIKRQVLRNTDGPLTGALVQEALLQGLSFATPEHAQRADAFMARKRGTVDDP